MNCKLDYICKLYLIRYEDDDYGFLNTKFNDDKDKT